MLFAHARLAVDHVMPHEAAYGEHTRSEVQTGAKWAAAVQLAEDLGSSIWG